VFAFRTVSRELVIEGLRVPLDEREALAVVIGVAAYAILAGSRLQVVGSVQTLSRRKPGGDLAMTIQATKCRLTGSQFVTTGAVGGSIQRFVSLRKRAGRNLARHQTGSNK